MTITHGWTINWTCRDGSKSSVHVEGYPTSEEARAAVIQAATEVGWTPPRWWQYWRWSDTRIEA